MDKGRAGKRGKLCFPTRALQIRKGIRQVLIHLKSDLSVDAKKDNEGKYKVTLGLFTSREDYVNSQNVFDAWNFDENRVPSSDAEIGQKTQSISAFTQLVADKHYMQDKPGMRNIVFYLDIE